MHQSQIEPFFFALISSSHHTEDVSFIGIISINLCCSLSFAQMTTVLFFAFGLSYPLQSTIFLMRWSTPSQFPDGHINTLYPGAVIHHMAHLCAFCEGSLRARFIATLSPSPPTPLLGSFPLSLLLHPNDKTDRLKVCCCCRDLNQARYSVGDYYKIVDPV